MEERKTEIRDALLDQLEAKGAHIPVFCDLVDKYMDLWQDVADMRADIKERGRRYKAFSASGKEYEKENENIKLIPTYIRQMQSLLSDMKLSVETVADMEGVEL